MKILILCLVLSVIALSEAFTESQLKRLGELNKECAKQSNLDPEIIKKATETKEYPDTPNFKKHLLCLSKVAGLQDAKGEVHVEPVEKTLNNQMKDPAGVKKLLDKCVIRRNTPEQTAFESLWCFHKNLPDDVTIFL